MKVSGVVKMYRQADGYGFLTRDDGGGDVFVHCTDVERSGLDRYDIDAGQRYTFDVQPTPRGGKAINLVLVQPSPESQLPSFLRKPKQLHSR